MKSKNFTIEFKNNSSGGHLNLPSGMHQHLENLLNLVALATGVFIFTLIRQLKGGADRNRKGYGISSTNQEMGQITMWAQVGGGNENCRDFVLTVPPALRNGQFTTFVAQLTAAIETGERQYTEDQLKVAADGARRSWGDAAQVAEKAHASLQTIESARDKAKQDIAAARIMLDEATRSLADIEETQLPPAVRNAHQTAERAKALEAEFNGLNEKLKELSRARVKQARAAVSGLSPDEVATLIRELQQQD